MGVTNNFSLGPVYYLLIGGGALFLVMSLFIFKCSPDKSAAAAAFARGLGFATLVFSCGAAALVPLTIYKLLPTDGSSQILTQGKWTTSSVVVVATAGILFLLSAIWLSTKNNNCRGFTAGILTVVSLGLGASVLLSVSGEMDKLINGNGFMHHSVGNWNFQTADYVGLSIAAAGLVVFS